MLGLSAPCPPKPAEEAEKFFRDKGITVSFSCDPARYYGKKDHLFSCDSIPNRVQAISDLLEGRTKADLCLSLRGGFGVLETLDRMPAQLSSKAVPSVVGFSDSTAFLTALFQRYGLVSLHGPSFLSFGADDKIGQRESMWTHLRELLEGKKQIFSSTEMEHGWGPSQGEGVLVGGNLRTFLSLFGTVWQPKIDGALLFFEELNETPFEIYRSFLQLRLSEGFAGIRGIVLGDFLNCLHPRSLGPTLGEVFEEVFREVPFPVYRGAPFGHGPVNKALPVGRLATLSPAGLELLD